MENKVNIRIGYLPITDHLVLGVSSHFDKNRFVHVAAEPVLFHDWNVLREELEKGRLDGAFILAPLAMDVKRRGHDIKVVLLGHREGSALIVRKDLACRSVKDLEGKTIAVPHEFSNHALLLREMLEKDGLIYGKDVDVVEVSPTEMVNKLARREIDGYIVAEPFGSQAEEQNIGKVLALTKDIRKHHLCCVLVLNNSFVRKHATAVQEFVDSLVEAGNLINTCPQKASEIGAEFLHQSSAVIERVLSEKEKRVTAWDLFPAKDELDGMQTVMAEKAKLIKEKINIEDFVDTSFATKAYQRAALRRKKRIQKRNRLKKVIFPLLVFSILIGVWEMATIFGHLSAVLLPTPIDVMSGTVELFTQGVLTTHIYTSLLRVFVGFFLAALLAIPIGLLLGTYKHARIAFDPLIQVLRPISPIAWIPLAILWFGIGNKPAVFIIFITSFFPILLATASSLKNIDPIIIKSAVNFGASGRQLLTKVILPAAFPFIMIGLRISLAFAWVIIVAAEMVGMRSGLGFMILDARNYLRTDLIISGMIIIGIIGLVLDRMTNYLEMKVKTKWGYRDSSGNI